MKPVIKKILLILFILPFLIRLLYFCDINSQPFFQKNILLSYTNHNLASAIATGKGAPYLLFRSPYYSLLISFFYRVFGTEPLIIRSIQWGTGAIGCLLIFCISRLFFGKKESFLAFLISSLYIPFVFFEGELIEQPLVTFFGLCSIYLFSLLKKQSRVYLQGFLASIFFGISVLLRPETILSLPLIIISVFLFPFNTSRKVKISGIVLGISIIAVFLVKNPQLFLKVDENRIGTNAAINFYIGNNPKATGYTPIIPEAGEMPETHPEAEKYFMNGITLSGILYAKTQINGDLSSVSKFWMHKSIEFIKSDPLKYLYLEFKKLILFFDGYLITNQKDIYVLRNFSSLLNFLLFNILIYFPLGIIIPLFLTGLKNKNQLGEKLLLLAIPCGCLLSTLIFFHSARFIYPAVPFFIIFASVGFWNLYESLRLKSLKQFYNLSIIFFIGLFLSNIDFFGANKPRFAQEYYNIATMYLENGKIDKARQMYLRSLKYDYLYEPSLINLGTIFKETGQYQEALRFFQKLYDPVKTTWATVYNITDFYYTLRDFQSALKWGKIMVKDFPDNPESYNLLGEIYLATQNPEQAIVIFTAGADKFPHYSLLSINLGSAYASSGKHEEALKWYYNVINKTHYYPQVYYYLSISLVNLKKYKEAEDVIGKGIGFYPNDIRLYFLLADLYRIQNKSQEEENCFRIILNIDKANREAFFQLARILASQKKYKEALPYAEKAKNLNHQQADLLIELIRDNINK